MATRKNTSSTAIELVRVAGANPLGEVGFEYLQQIWGDLVYGTKDQLQRIGIALGKAFPGELGGPKRSMTVTDPRGFSAKIEIYQRHGEGIFSAKISFPGRDRKEHWVDHAAGVRKRTESAWGDQYVGTAVALAAAGLIRFDQLPGQPGMRKMRVTILPDGTPDAGATTNHRTANDAGAKLIERASKTEYMVTVKLSDAESQQRHNEYLASMWQWEDKMRELPRPAPLIDLPDAIGRPVKVTKSIH